MSNQRRGNWKPAALGDGMGEMKLRNFFRDAADLLELNGQIDAAFYFDQVADAINAGKPLPVSREEIGRVLGL